MLSLVMNPGLPEESSMVLSPGTVTIGRTKDNHVVCVHKSLSRKHARIDFDGRKICVADLQSKNGVFRNGERVAMCNLVEGDSFRCGDVTFLLEGSTARRPRVPLGAQTLPSPLARGGPQSKRGSSAPPVAVQSDEDERYKTRLFLLIRASELLIGAAPLDRLLDELVVLAAQVIEVDRIALLLLDEEILEMKPRVTKAFAGAAPRSYSKRVVDWVVDNGSPTSFANVSKDTTLLGDSREDAQILGAMAVPINPGGGTIGVLYADSVSRTDAFRPEDLAVFCALANIAAVAVDSHALRRSGASGASIKR